MLNVQQALSLFNCLSLFLLVLVSNFSLSWASKLYSIFLPFVLFAPLPRSLRHTFFNCLIDVMTFAYSGDITTVPWNTTLTGHMDSGARKRRRKRRRRRTRCWMFNIAKTITLCLGQSSHHLLGVAYWPFLQIKTKYADEYVACVV